MSSNCVNNWQERKTKTGLFLMYHLLTSCVGRPNEKISHAMIYECSDLGISVSRYFETL